MVKNLAEDVHARPMVFVACNKPVNVKTIVYTLLIATLMGGFLVSCAESDDFSTNTNLKLSFSSDTISFDTVFTSIGSSVIEFKIYNRNSKSLSIQSIEIVNPDESGFTMNIDGQQGVRFCNIDILKKDSLYGFLRVKVDPLDENNPLLIRDSIRFVTNGNIQYIVLKAIGRNVYKLTNVEITKDTLLKADKPYLIFDSLKVAQGIKLSIEAGAELFFHNKASMHVWGSLNAEGQVGRSITFRNDRLDRMNGVIPYSNIPGQWGGIVFYPDSYDNQLKNVIVKNAETGLCFYPSNVIDKKAQLYNVIVSNSSENCVVATNCFIEAVNCLFTNSRKAVLDIRGGHYSFLHCTIANYYQWSTREGATVLLNNIFGGENYPFVQCDFINSIVYGTRVDELYVSKNANVDFNVTFRNCLIRNRQEFSNKEFINVVWNKNPEFYDLNSTSLYEYNFKLTEPSFAIGIADPEYSQNAPYDLSGNSRLIDGVSDAGCYEWIADAN